MKFAVSSRRQSLPPALSPSFNAEHMADDTSVEVALMSRESETDELSCRPSDIIVCNVEFESNESTLVLGRRSEHAQTFYLPSSTREGIYNMSRSSRPVRKTIHG